MIGVTEVAFKTDWTDGTTTTTQFELENGLKGKDAVAPQGDPGPQGIPGIPGTWGVMREIIDIPLNATDEGEYNRNTLIGRTMYILHTFLLPLSFQECMDEDSVMQWTTDLLTPPATKYGVLLPYQLKGEIVSSPEEEGRAAMRLTLVLGPSLVNGEIDTAHSIYKMNKGFTPFLVRLSCERKDSPFYGEVSKEPSSYPLQVRVTYIHRG